MATIICEICGIEKEVRPVHARTGRAKFCSRSCSSKSKRGTKSPRWKGGRYSDDRGYVYIKAPDHPHAYQYGYVPESHIVAEKAIGRYLQSGEVVHHINGIKNDNRPDNLSVMTNSEHVKRHGTLRESNVSRERHGVANPFYGRSHTEASKALMRDAKRGKSLSPEHKNNMRTARRRFLENAARI